MKYLIFIQIAVLLIFSIILGQLDCWQDGFAFFLGGTIVLVNLLLHVFVWGQMIRKKLVALAMFVIVFKYAILGTIIYEVLKLPWMTSRSTLWFCLGVSSLMISAVIFALRKEENVI